MLRLKYFALIWIEIEFIFFQYQKLMSSHIKEKITRESKEPNQFNFTYCDYLNVSICHLTETEDSIVMNIYNPIVRSIVTYVRVPVKSKEYIVFDANGDTVTSQLSHVSAQTTTVRHGSHGSAVYELTFEVKAPALGYSTYFIEKLGEADFKGRAIYTQEQELKGDGTSIENEALRLEFSEQTGHLVHMSRKDEGIEMDVEQQFFWYNASVGNEESIQTSGAYIFRPNKSQPFDVCELNKAAIYITKGPVYEEVRQVFGPYVSQVVRLYKSADYAEFEHTVGPIPVADGWGKEIITRFDTNIESSGKFYTDANGREMKERIRNHRDTWKLNVTEPIAGNYYPVNSRIFIKDDNSQLTIMNDRSQGGTKFHCKFTRNLFLNLREF